MQIAYLLLPLLVDQSIGQAPLNAHGLGQGGIGLAHVALQGQTGVGLFEDVPGRAGGPAEGAALA